MVWIVALIIVNIIISIFIWFEVFYQKYHPNSNNRKETVGMPLFGGKKKNKPKWQDELKEYEAEQKEMKNRPVS